MMSMVALQELSLRGHAVFDGHGASTSGAGLTDVSGTSLYKSPAQYRSGHLPVRILHRDLPDRRSRLGKDYPKYFLPMKRKKLVSTVGAGVTAPNSPEQINSGMSRHEPVVAVRGLNSAQDLCFKQYWKKPRTNPPAES